MDKLIRRIDLRNAKPEELPGMLRREWLVTNGLGGYASGTISGSVTWRYHGLLIAALPEPFGRTVMLNHLAESVQLPDGRLIQIGGEEPSHPGEGPAANYLTEFRLENHLPVWRYEVEGIVIERFVLFLYGQNTVHVTYNLISDQELVYLVLKPSIHFRGHEQAVDSGPHEDYRLSVAGDRYEVTRPDLLPTLRLVMRGEDAAFTYDGGRRREIFYPKEADRGYQSRGLLWSPGSFRVKLEHRREATLIASTEWWNTMLALAPEEALR